MKTGPVGVMIRILLLLLPVLTSCSRLKVKNTSSINYRANFMACAVYVKPSNTLWLMTPEECALMMERTPYDAR